MVRFWPITCKSSIPASSHGLVIVLSVFYNIMEFYALPLSPFLGYDLVFYDVLSHLGTLGSDFQTASFLMLLDDLFIYFVFLFIYVFIYLFSVLLSVLWKAFIPFVH